MREDIKVNLEREVGARIKARNKEAVMDALVKVTEMDVPKVMIEQDSQRLAEQTRQDMAQRGMDVKSMPFPAELFATKAERRVRLGLILSQLVRTTTCKPRKSRSRPRSKTSRRATKTRRKS